MDPSKDWQKNWHSKIFEKNTGVKWNGMKQNQIKSLSIELIGTECNVIEPIQIVWHR